jgi:hypothetical protein
MCTRSKYFPAWLAYLSRRIEIQSESLDTIAQSRDALNMCVSLITLASDAKFASGTKMPFSLNEHGHNPLEHVFGSGRIKSRDVNTMTGLINAFANDLTTTGANAPLEIAAAPRRRSSVGARCDPLLQRGKSMSPSSPLVIARTLLARSMTPDSPVELLGPIPRLGCGCCRASQTRSALLGRIDLRK